jgi:lipid-A-disaccharide synthase
MMKECIDKMLVILPFEKDYFKNKWNWDVEYVGHPLVEVIDEFKANHQPLVGSQQPTPDSHRVVSQQPVIPSIFATPNSQLVALLPGSRKQEIMKKLPIMLEVTKDFPDQQFIIAKAPAVEDAFYNELLKDYSNVSHVANQTYELLLKADAALVTSGTATLETALFGIPEVVCYKGSAISYQIAKRVVKVKYISLVNLIMDRLVVNELIQDKLTRKNLTEELHDLLFNDLRIRELKMDYAELKELLSKGGNASEKAARSIVQFLKTDI